jgi:hypothetical protein
MTENEIDVDKIRNLVLEILHTSSIVLEDGSTTWSNAWLLQRRINLLRLQITELKNTLFGTHIDQPTSDAFDLMAEILIAKIETHNSRSFEGFWRKPAYHDSIRPDRNIFDSQRQQDANIGLSRLERLNIFGRKL